MSILDPTPAQATTVDLPADRTGGTSGPVREAAAPPSARSERAPRRGALLGVAERYALLALLALIVLFFSVYPDSAEAFPTRANLNVLLANQSVTALLALSVLLPLICGHFDFSVGAVAASSSVLCAGLMSRHGTGLLLCVLAAVLLGAVVGAVNGLLVTRFGMSAFVTTLGMATLLGGGIQWYTKGQAISSGISDNLIAFGSLSWFGVPRLVYVVAATLLALWYLLSHTPYGRSLYAIGSNPRAAALVGLPVRRYSFLGFVTAGTIAGVAGVLLAARTGGATADSGTAMLFPALAAVFLGATAITPGRFNVWGTLIGVLFVSVSVSGLTLAGASDWVNPVFNGLALLLAVALSSLLANRRAAGRVRG